VRVGRRILVFGGGTGEAGTADVQAVTADGTASTVGALPEPRADLVTARVGNATYVFGGANGDAILPDILRTTDGVTFTRVGTLPVPVRYPAVAVVGTAIYLFGGVSNSARGIDTPAVQRFDTKRGVVDTVAQLPTSVSHASAVVLRGHVFVLGGYVDNSRLSDQILRFDPATGTSTAAGTLPAPLSDAAAVVVAGRGYLVGGQGAERAPRATVTILTPNDEHASK
jgi:N-acetylneuraminic acid mutarotase